MIRPSERYDSLFRYYGQLHKVPWMAVKELYLLRNEDAMADMNETAIRSVAELIAQYRVRFQIATDGYERDDRSELAAGVLGSMGLWASVKNTMDEAKAEGLRITVARLEGALSMEQTDDLRRVLKRTEE